MRNFLRHFLTWLDTRFPEKVVVTLEDYNGLKIKLISIQKEMITRQDLANQATAFGDRLDKQLESIKRLESEINKFNISLGFAGSLKSAGPFNR